MNKKLRRLASVLGAFSLIGGNKASCVNSEATNKCYVRLKNKGSKNSNFVCEIVLGSGVFLLICGIVWYSWPTELKKCYKEINELLVSTNININVLQQKLYDEINTLISEEDEQEKPNKELKNMLKYAKDWILVMIYQFSLFNRIYCDSGELHPFLDYVISPSMICSKINKCINCSLIKDFSANLDSVYYGIPILKTFSLVYTANNIPEEVKKVKTNFIMTIKEKLKSEKHEKKIKKLTGIIKSMFPKELSDQLLGKQN